MTMKRLVIILCCCLGSPSAWAIDCASAPGDAKTGWYSWREIDGRRCWFLKKAGAMPPKSQLHWPAKARQDARATEPPSPSKERTEPVAAAEAAATKVPEPVPSALPRFKTVRVKPAPDVSLRLGNGLDLMNDANLTTLQAVGGTRQKLGSGASDDSFSVRFKGQQ
jgi:hypothetical protein